MRCICSLICSRVCTPRRRPPRQPASPPRRRGRVALRRTRRFDAGACTARAVAAARMFPLCAAREHSYTGSVRLLLARGQWPARTRLRGLVVAREWRCIMWVALWAASSRRDAATTLGWVQCSPGEKNYVLGVHRRTIYVGTAAAAHVRGRQSWRRAPPAAPRRACPRGDPRAARRRAPRAAPRGGRGRGRRCGANACVRRLAAQRRGSCAASPKELRMLRVHPTGALGVGVACSAQRGSQRGGGKGLAASAGAAGATCLPVRARTAPCGALARVGHALRCCMAPGRGMARDRPLRAL